jgi:flagellar assembly protein FliH
MHNSIPDIALIAVKAAEKIIKKELEINDTIILEVVSEVINSISRDEKEIIIKTHPNDTEIVKERIPDIYPYESTTKIIVMEDESVDWGSCIVETKNGIIDARFSTQLQVLEKALRSGI